MSNEQINNMKDSYNLSTPTLPKPKPNRPKLMSVDDPDFKPPQVSFDPSNKILENYKRIFESINKVNYVSTDNLKVVDRIEENEPQHLKDFSQKEVVAMDDSSKFIMERLERDSRERELRYHNESQERENRYREEMREQNRIFRQEAKEREERIEAMINKLSSNFDETKKEIKDEIRQSKDEMSQTAKHVQSLTVANIWGTIATVLAIIGLAVTVIIFIFNK